MSKTKNKVKLQYKGSVGWLIFWTLVFFPIALVLFCIQSEFRLNSVVYSLEYDGDSFWLCFWTLACFPIAIILALINGFSFSIEDNRE